MSTELEREFFIEVYYLDSEGRHYRPYTIRETNYDRAVQTAENKVVEKFGGNLNFEITCVKSVCLGRV